MSAATDTPDDKEFASVLAKAAQIGCCLYRLADGGFLLTRWSLNRELPDLRAVNTLLSQMGGAR